MSALFPDYPAAHSQDTWWFAVDAQGRVAMFDTNENGPVPERDGAFGVSDWERVELYFSDLSRTAVGVSPAAEMADWYAEVGVTYFDYEDDYYGPVRRYKRTGTPALPIHVDQCPPEIRRALRSVCFTGVRFDQCEPLQILDHVTCRLYSPGYQIAYLRPDGVTVRSITGEEDGFAEFVREYRTGNPVAAEKVRFEAPSDLDYPAAHSMDTYWFAVDQRGHVAAFETGEDGHAPNVKDNDIFEELYERRFGPYDYDANDGWDPAKWAELLGLVFYSYPINADLLVLPYERSVFPPMPLHIDQLPYNLRWKCREVDFHMLCFANHDTLQPHEFYRDLLITFDCCYAEDRPAYLCADGTTVRPIRGSEAKFAEFVREHRGEYPENYRFDGPTE